MLTTHAALAVPAESVGHAAKTAEAFWHDQGKKLFDCLEIYPLMFRAHAVQYNEQCDTTLPARDLGELISLQSSLRAQECCQG